MKRDGLPISSRSPEVRGRLAPSPTGLLHLGHARSFVIAWWSARRNGGSIVLRHEDLDPARARVDYAQQIETDLRWLGLDWDGPASFQSSTAPALLELAHQLVDAGHGYPCICSRGDIRGAVAAPHRGDPEINYPGTCRGRFVNVAQAEARSGRLAGIRFCAPDRELAFDDGIAGYVSENVARQVGDFLIIRRDKVPAYQLAVVVDDARQAVNQVIRGDDLLGSTPRQLALHAALNLTPPSYYHLGLVLDEYGQRLAKRSDALSLARLRARGVDPNAIIRWVADSCYMPDQGFASARERIDAFQLSRLDRRPVRLDARALARFGL